MLVWLEKLMLSPVSSIVNGRLTNDAVLLSQFQRLAVRLGSKNCQTFVLRAVSVVFADAE
jgi:hypothetical protein